MTSRLAVRQDDHASARTVVRRRADTPAASLDTAAIFRSGLACACGGGCPRCQAPPTPLPSGGEPLEAPTRALMEARLDHDFGEVRIHAGGAAADAALAVNARAFTLGRDVVFGAGQYLPGTEAGQRLLAHELAHVVQQSRGGATAPSPLATGGLEQAAEQAASAVGRGERASVSGASLPGLARQPLSLNQTVNPHSLTDAELAREIMLVQQWLREHSEPGDDRAQLTAALASLGQEALAREPAPSSAPGSSTVPIAMAGVGLGGVGLTPVGPPTPPPPFVTELIGESAPEVLETAPELLEAAPELLEVAPEIVEAAPLLEAGPGTAAGIGLGAVAAGALAFLAVMLYPSNTIVSGDEERRMLEEAQRRAQPAPEPRVEPVPETEPRKKEPETCATKFPGVPRCDLLPTGYVFLSPQAALGALKAARNDPNLSLRKPAVATSGPCPGIGTHYNVRSGKTYVASIVCCPCCLDTPAGPVMSRRCKIV